MTLVYINVFNRLTTTKAMAEQVVSLGGDPILIDNDSDWEPLLEFYAECPYEVVRLRSNMGHHAPWLSGAVGKYECVQYVVTDCDLDLTGVPGISLTFCADRLPGIRAS